MISSLWTRSDPVRLVREAGEEGATAAGADLGGVPASQPWGEPQLRAARVEPGELTAEHLQPSSPGAPDGRKLPAVNHVAFSGQSPLKSPTLITPQPTPHTCSQDCPSPPPGLVWHSPGNTSPHPQDEERYQMVLEPRVLLTELQPDTTYTVRVRTMTPLGPGPFSPDHEFRTSPPGGWVTLCSVPNPHATVIPLRFLRPCSSQ